MKNDTGTSSETATPSTFESSITAETPISDGTPVSHGTQVSHGTPVSDGTPEITETTTPAFLVWRLSMKWRMAVDRAIAPMGLTHAQYSFLGALLDMERSGQRPTQSQLADQTGLEPLYVSKLARALDLAGLIRRERHPVDARALQLSLTDVGWEAIDLAMSFVHPILDELLDPFGGLGAERTDMFVRDLVALLDVPLRDLA